MSRQELKEIIKKIVDKIEKAPEAACLFGDSQCDNCDVTTKYAIGEEG